MKSLNKIYSTAIFKKIGDFLNKGDNESNEQVAFTLRMPKSTKNFYESLAEGSGALNTILSDTLTHVKEDSILEYLETKTPLNYKLNLQLDKIFHILNKGIPDYNDNKELISYILDEPFNPSVLLSRKEALSFFTKQRIKRICNFFDYDYDWVIGDASTEQSPYHHTAGIRERRWYKNTTCFINHYFFNYLLKPEVKNIRFRFVFNKKNALEIIKNAIQDKKTEELFCHIVIEISYRINDSTCTVYRLAEYEDISYSKCAKHFIELCNMIITLATNGSNKGFPLDKFDFPYGHYIPNANRGFMDGKHVVELFNTLHYNNVYIDDISELSINKMSILNIIYSSDLMKSVFMDILSRNENSTDDWHDISQIDITNIEYIASTNELYDLFKIYDGYIKTADSQVKSDLISFNSSGKPLVSFSELKKLIDLIDNEPKINTSFG
ncbi:hypothetical protein [Cysteiniphilum litorale]|uniref:hypothetical protein n=1 Tax=Cysteiniphilum litorale TaxID=2056700 RepID=UPI003F8811FE